LGFKPKLLCTFHNIHACYTYHPSQLDDDDDDDDDDNGGDDDGDDDDDDDDNNNNNNKKAEKNPKYKDLTTEIQRMWNVKTKVTPVKTGANGSISKSFRKHPSNIKGKYEIKVLQKTAILSTAHIRRKVLP
jgi:hypothetical protein